MFKKVGIYCLFQYFSYQPPIMLYIFIVCDIKSSLIVYLHLESYCIDCIRLLKMLVNGTIIILFIHRKITKKYYICYVINNMFLFMSQQSYTPWRRSFIEYFFNSTIPDTFLSEINNSVI